MHTFDSLQTARATRPSVVTVGAFDGVHLGHQALIRHLVRAAHEADQDAAVISFFPHPDEVLHKETGRFYLTTPEQKAAQMAALGVDTLVLHPFNDQVRHMRAAEFVRQLIGQLNMRALWATADFAMGYQREGTVDFLREQGRQLGYDVHTIDHLLLNDAGERVSSTRIRQALRAGDVAQAAAWLGRAYRLSGEVIHGDKRGRTIGFPTANIAVWPRQIIPSNGVYAAWAWLGEAWHLAVTNIGQRPTFEGQNITVEAHLLDFSAQIYGQHLTLDILARLRPEQRFNGVDELKAQIDHDISAARAGWG